MSHGCLQRKHVLYFLSALLIGTKVFSEQDERVIWVCLSFEQKNTNELYMFDYNLLASGSITEHSKIVNALLSPLVTWMKSNVIMGVDWGPAGKWANYDQQFWWQNCGFIWRFRCIIFSLNIINYLISTGF